MLHRLLTGLALATTVAFAATAQDLPKNQFKVIGLNSPTPVSIEDEVPFWRKTIPEASNGAITADVTPLDQMGIDDKTMLRLLKLGVMDFAAMDISKMAGDDPRFEGCDLAGLTLDPDKARAACNAYRDVIDRQMQKNWNAKLLAFGGNTPQVFWCREVIGGLDDLKGKKVRVFNNTMRDFLGGVGATAVSMAFAEVVPALQQRRRRLRRHRQPVGQHRRLARGDQVALSDVARLEHQRAGGQPQHLEAARSQDAGLPARAVQGLRGQDVGDDQDGDRRSRQLQHRQAALHHGQARQHRRIVPVKPDEAETHKKLVEGAVLAGWAKRCGAECAKEWNETVGKALGLTAPTP